MDYEIHWQQSRNCVIKNGVIKFLLYHCAFPGTMLEDANSFSRIGQTFHLDPLLKEYLTFTRIVKSKDSPDTEEINSQNLPSHRKKHI